MFKLKGIIKPKDFEENLSKSWPSRAIENCFIVWLQSSIQNSNEYKDDVFSRLQHISKFVETFIDSNECIDFVTNVKNEKVFMIISQSIDLVFLPLIQDIPQLYAIYFLENDHMHVTQSIEKYRKVKGVFTSIDSICDVLKLDMTRVMVDLTPFSIISATSLTDPDELDQSFMYTQLLKEIILDLEHNDNAKQEFIDYYCTHFQEHQYQSKSITQFQQYYEDHSPIWWYTKELFIYSTLNKALRTQDTETIIKMGFFLYDLHQEIRKKHAQTARISKMTVYRGQGVLQADFEKMQKNKGGLISFNNFLSTSSDQIVSLAFAESARENPDLVGVLFHMDIDPTVASTPYTALDDNTNFAEEKEILFSMHTVYRINDMKEISDRLWEIQLILTSDNDPQLKCLTDYMRKEIGIVDGWYSMSLLMLRMGKFEKALEIFHILGQTTLNDDPDKDDMHTAVAITTNVTQGRMGHYSAALSSLEKILKHCEKFPPADDSILPVLSLNIGTAHQYMGNYATALSYLKKALTDYQNIPDPDHRMFALIYNNTALVHQSMGNYAQALSYAEKSLDIHQKFLPLNHPDLATNYNNIAVLHQLMSNYTKALSYFEKALVIQQKSLPSDHPNIGFIYNNIASAHQSMNNYPLALAYFEKALKIQQKSLPSNHPDLATNYNNTAAVHQLMSNYAKALSYFEKALVILQKSLHSDHPNIGFIYNNIATVHQSMNTYPLALVYFEKALEIQQKSLPSNHPHLATYYNNMAAVYQSMRNYVMALSYLEKALEIYQESLPSNHPNLGLIYNSIGLIHQSMDDYQMALSYFEIALEIWQTSLPSDDPSLALLYNSISGTYRSINNYAMARTYGEKALQILQKSLPHHHPELAKAYTNFALLNQSKGDLWTACSNIETVLDIQQKSLLNNRSLHASSSNDFDAKYQQINCEMRAVSQAKVLLETKQRLFSSDRPSEAEIIENVDKYENMLETTLTHLENLEKAFQLQQTTCRTDDLFMGHFSGSRSEENQIIERYLNAISLMKKSLTKQQKLLTLAQSEIANGNTEIDEMQSATKDLMIAQSQLLETV